MNAIVSVTSDWAIGIDNKLLVRNKADMRRFVSLTTGGTVIMGRKTLESFPGGPLKNRRNVVISRNPEYTIYGAEVVSSPEEALRAIANEDPARVWLIGGESIYRVLLPHCERAYVTKNDVTCEADAFFPNLDKSDEWQVEEREKGGATEAGVPFEFVTYRKL